MLCCLLKAGLETTGVGLHVKMSNFVLNLMGGVGSCKVRREATCSVLKTILFASIAPFLSLLEWTFTFQDGCVFWLGFFFFSEENDKVVAVNSSESKI